MIIDTHAHLNFNAFKNDADEVIRRSLDNGVFMVNVGSKFETSKRAIELAEKYPAGVFAAIGLHPIHATPDFKKNREEASEGGPLAAGEIFDIEKYKELAKSKKVVAIGEIGLDYYYKPKTNVRIQDFKNKQKEIFVTQLELAKELDFPVIFHCRMAHQDMIDTLKLFTNSHEKVSSIRGVVHCFTGSWEEAQKYMAMGFYIGINGIIFKLPMDEVIKKIPLDKILVETDCPYLTPLEVGAERNEPIFVKYVIKKIAELKGISDKEVAEKTFDNAKELFGI